MHPHQQEYWCIGKITGDYLARTEQVLETYALDYDPGHPVVCYDERPCFLIGDVVAPVRMKEGARKKVHYEYEKNGSAALLATIEPLTGKRIMEVSGTRTKADFTRHCQAVSAAYPDAKTIKMVLDNLNTHNKGSFYENLPAAEARELAKRFEFIHTPLSGSWLNMIEIEFAALSKQCLERRIPNIDMLKKEVEAIRKEREEKGVKIVWQFTIEKARKTMSSKYNGVNENNPIVTKT